MTTTDDIGAWLRVVWAGRERQLDEDERVAREATQGKWRWGDPGGRTKMALLAGTWPTETMVVPSGSPDVYPSRNDARHIARWDPARVLAEITTERRDIEAKRRIMEAWRRQIEDDDPAVYLAGDILPKLLALSYAGHPGYREEWRP